MNAFKKMVVNILSLGPTSRGFTGKEARRWVRKVYRHYVKDTGYTFKETRWAIKHGFMPEQVEGLNITEENYKDTISAKEYAFLRPLNGGYSKWITDKITIFSIFKPYRKDMPTCYYQLSKRYSDEQIIPLDDKNAGDTFEDVFKLIKEKKQVLVAMANGRRASKISYNDGKFYYDDTETQKDDIINKMVAHNAVLVITELIEAKKEFEGATIRLTVFNESGDNPVIGDSYIEYNLSSKVRKPLIDKTLEGEDLEEIDDEPENGEEDQFRKIYAYIDKATGEIKDPVSIDAGKKTPETSNPNNGMPIEGFVPSWAEIIKVVDSLCRFVPQLEFFGMEITITDDGFKITRMVNHPSYPQTVPFSKETSKYLAGKVEQKKAAYKGTKTRIKRGFKKIKLKVRSRYAKMFFPKGLVPYLSIKWFGDVKNDFVTNKDTTLKEKLWALKHGFLSYRLHQYGITKENHLNYISDFEYKWLRHINNKYRHWMEDKITVKYICSDYNNCFPEYYYHIVLKNGNNKVIAMMDCPKGYSNTYEDIFNLAMEKGSLALKPDEGSHGDGFYKLSYDDGKFYLNHNEATKEQVLGILEDVNNQYLVTEYINMHHEIKRIYDGAVNTIRMIVFKKDGKNPVIGNAYMRFGSKKTGAVDNMGAGGMFCKIDIDTGKYYDAKIIEDNEIKPCLHHPDSGVKIEGILPNWEKTKEQVLEVAKAIPQMEYFGFDLALTEDGIKFPEINRFPDYPAIEKYTDKTIDYLLYKLEQKKKKYGYDENRGHKLVKLPRR
ncbi:MAG: sugar-transfer associated ATP-grasp domain-containing protein [Eubacteriales bacterium]|nr:sugar-transfer associated ATP-grasp domain-containing protein [Eubacteriales bacterium]